ncbi:CYTH domain-containing protein [Viridibacillus sp. YIM B01967]|uniref:CYTH domain-containing protein n=1 Tax=Viridibacillus soli TaxID=2798301 RepID=A0ABS1H669_9BACL|nr:CYTH domain-containing protein [Viridibacillus soli]MBK3494905.1 CYTH domain-containing protein [Viridibacillus soli]
MVQQLEIEFKNLLTKNEYVALCLAFAIPAEGFHEQTNHYFDTADFQLKNACSGLRIREVQSRFECTLKEPATGIGLIETTDLLTKEHVHTVLNGGTLKAGEVDTRFKKLQVNPEELQLLGTLFTKRAEIKYNGGLLVFDHSRYLDTDDYELEFEVTNEETGRVIFEEFLAAHSIPVRVADKKIARFMAAVNKKRG